MASKRTEFFNAQHFFVGPSNIDSSDSDEQEESVSFEEFLDEVDYAIVTLVAMRLTEV